MFQIICRISYGFENFENFDIDLKMRIIGWLHFLLVDQLTSREKKRIFRINPGLKFETLRLECRRFDEGWMQKNVQKRAASLNLGLASNINTRRRTFHNA